MALTERQPELQHQHGPPERRAGTEPARRQGRWIDQWQPEDPAFWRRFGARVARRNLVWSIAAEHIGFSVWLLWSAVVIYLPQAGFAFSVNQLFWLVALPNLVGATLRFPYTFAVPRFGGRNWTIISALLLMIPLALLTVCVANPGTPYWMFLVAAASAGLGGGNFASSMANISFFYPDSRKGYALGLNAAGGNVGVSSVQLVVPAIVGLAIFGSASGLHLENIALVWVPLSIVAAAGAYFFMDNLTEAKSSFRDQVAVARQGQTWVMALLYVGTFGSFIGYSSALPLLMKTQFPAVHGVYFAFLGALVGSAFRPVGGWLADRIGGARITAAVFVAMTVGVGGVIWSVQHRAFGTVPGVLPRALRPHRPRQRVDLPDDPRDLPHAGRCRRLSPRGDGERAAADRRGPRRHLRSRRLRWLPGAAGTGRVGQPHRRHRGGSCGLRRLLRGVLRRHVVVLPAPHRHGVASAQPGPRERLMATETHCPYCSLQCGMRLESTGRGAREVTVAPWPEFPTNAGGLCRKGWTSPALLRHRERLTSPLVRDRATGELTAVSWDEALDRVATGLIEIQERHGRDSVGVFGGGGLTNEKAYALGKFARVALRTSAIDYNGRWCMSSAATAGQRAFGLDRGLPFPLADIEDASVVVLVGSNLAETAPPAARHLQALKDNGGTLVVIDPRVTATAARADVHVQPVPGTDLALANGVLHAIVSDGQVDQDYVDARTSGFDQVRQLVAGYWPERVERITGVSCAGDRGAGSTSGTGRLGHHPHGARCRTARLRHGHGPGLDQRRSGARPARTPARRLWLHHRPGQRSGRARTRSEGRPAARLPQDRRPCCPRARRPGVGHRTGRPAGTRPVGIRDVGRDGDRRRRPGAARVRVQHRGLGPERLPHR